MIISKQELLDKITNDELYKATLEQMKSDQRSQSQEFIKNFVSEFYDSLVLGIKKIAEDPQLSREFQRALVSDPSVVIAEDKRDDAERPQDEPGDG